MRRPRQSQKDRLRALRKPSRSPLNPSDLETRWALLRAQLGPMENLTYGERLLCKRMFTLGYWYGLRWGRVGGFADGKARP